MEGNGTETKPLDGANGGTEPKPQGGAEPNSGLEKGAEPEGEGKTGGGNTSYTQADVDKAVADAVAKANEGVEERIRNAVAEAQRLAQLPDKERMAEEERIERENFQREKAALAVEKLNLFAERRLAEAGLPISFAAMVTAADEKTTQERIDSFAKEYKGAVDSGVAERMKGSAPRGGAGIPPENGAKKMQDEINAAMKMYF